MALEVYIQKRFKEFKLDVSFSNTSNCMGILGASGCGKSMTLKCIAGIENPDEGRIVLNGKVLYDSEKKINIPPQKRNVGYMFQSYALFPMMTIKENIAVGIKGNREQKENETCVQIEKFHLEGLENRYPCQLSGGQQQRVALARIMAYSPQIIMLDEPFSALDSFLKDTLQLDLLETLKDYRGDVLMVSHNRDEIFKFCDTLSVMDNGQVEAQGRTRDIFKNPVNMISARLTGCKNISKINKISDYELEATDWGIRLTTVEYIDDSIVYVGIRGHRLCPRSKGESVNSMKIKLLRFVETPFEMEYIVKNENAKDSNDIWWIESKKEIDSEIREETPKYLNFPPKELMLLRL
jgi:molybdate transport system ATP-binding protein